MFSLNEKDVRLSNVNVRPELHGEEPVTAVDLKIEVKLANDQLALLDPDLKRALYRRDDDKPDLFDDQDSQHLTKLRFPQMGPLRWDHAVVGGKVKFHVGVSGKADIELEPVDVNNFTIEPQEGGTVVFNFRIQGHPEEEQLGRLGMLAGHDATLTVTPPKADPVPEEEKKPEGKPVKAPEAWPFPTDNRTDDEKAA